MLPPWTATNQEGWGDGQLYLAIDYDGDGIAEWTIQPTSDIVVHTGSEIYLPLVARWAAHPKSRHFRSCEAKAATSSELFALNPASLQPNSG